MLVANIISKFYAEITFHANLYTMRILCIFRATFLKLYTSAHALIFSHISHTFAHVLGITKHIVISFSINNFSFSLSSLPSYSLPLIHVFSLVECPRRSKLASGVHFVQKSAD